MPSNRSRSRSVRSSGSECSSDVDRVKNALIAAGESESIAEILAYRQAPLGVTSRTFWQGRMHVDQFEDDPESGAYLRAVAERHGVATRGKWYISQLADYPGDPKAWVDGPDDIRRICEERGWGCTGLVNVQPREPESGPPPYRVADDIVEEEFLAEAEENPALLELSESARREYLEGIRERISPDL